MHCRIRIFLVLTLLVFASSPLLAAEPEADALAARYEPEIRPLALKYCQDCHGPELMEAELDLSSFATWSDVRKDPQVWQRVGEMLDSGQMPPKDAPQPSDAERKQLQGWVRSFLTLEAKARAGDPGRVVLRRLSNAEFTYTLRDLTGVGSLDPAREFPVDGAAGEGFSNTGNALVMSPALVTKYLDAAKEVSRHAVLLPDGIRFSAATTRRDWTNETLDRIRALYSRHTDSSGGGDQVNLQGVVFDTNGGGRLPLEKYLAATLAERESLIAGRKTIDDVAREHKLNAKYLGTLWQALRSEEPSLLLDALRARWRKAKPADAAALAADIAAWQKELWRFNTVGHIGKVGGPKRWMDPVNPLAAQQELRFKLPAANEAGEVVLTLVTSDAGDGKEHDFVVWHSPRLVAPGRPDLLLKDLRQTAALLAAQRERVLADTVKYLAAAEEAAATEGKTEVAELAKKHGVELDSLAAWLNYLGIGAGGDVDLKGHFTNKIPSAANYDFVQGWGSHDTPLLLANSSDQHVRVPGNMKPHSVAVHPSPTLRAAVGWRSPVTTALRVEGVVTHAHPECGNGVTWWLELRRGSTRRRLAAGTAQGAKEFAVGPIEKLLVQKGDLVSLVIGPRDGNHSCDLTAVDLKLTSTEKEPRVWNLADVSKDILAANPHDDGFGNKGVWHFYTEPEKVVDTAAVIPADSLLAQWQAAQGEQRLKLAAEVATLLTSPPPAAKDSPNAVLHRQIASLGGPLFSKIASPMARREPRPPKDEPRPPKDTDEKWGLDPTLFGKHPDGSAIDPASLCVQAPSTLEVRLPADLVAGCELVATVQLHPQAAEGSAQAQVVPGKLERAAGLLPTGADTKAGGGAWTDQALRTSFGAPILVNDGSRARRRIEGSLDEFRQLFPAALCYMKIVPVDEVVTLTQFYREDDHLARLMLDEAQQADLNRLWGELDYVSQHALTQVDALEQLIQYATQDADPKVFEPLREPFQQRANAYQQQLLDTEPQHLTAVLEFAPQAYRRPLTAAEVTELQSLYARLRKEELPHELALRLTLARVLVAPAFLYKVEKPGPGAGQGPVSDFELATRLSYFLWSSTPDQELLDLAAAGKLHEPSVLSAQTRRMLKDPKTRRLATEFACQWLHIYDFDQLDEKSERHFPAFLGLRAAMYEESILFFTELFQNNGSVTDILDADHTFLNEALAKHYGIEGVAGEQWRRVEGIKQHARGGILAQATTLAKQSGASRTSPILRGNWISEVLLGERLPRPPKGVPPLPDDEADTEGLTVRQLVEKHVSDPKCAGCHRRIDPFGYALESFDAIGKHRDKDLAGRPIDAATKSPEGEAMTGLDGLRTYLLTVRRDAFTRQFCKKLLGYSLGRSVQLSDEPLLAEMQAKVNQKDFGVANLVEMIVASRQFGEIRGRETAYDE